MSSVVLSVPVRRGRTRVPLDRPARLERRDHSYPSLDPRALALAAHLGGGARRLLRAQAARRRIDRDRLLRTAAGVHRERLGKVPAERGGAGGMVSPTDARLAPHLHAGPSGGPAELSEPRLPRRAGGDVQRRDLSAARFAGSASSSARELEDRGYYPEGLSHSSTPRSQACQPYRSLSSPGHVRLDLARLGSVHHHRLPQASKSARRDGRRNGHLAGRHGLVGQGQTPPPWGW